MLYVVAEEILRRLHHLWLHIKTDCLHPNMEDPQDVLHIEQDCFLPQTRPLCNLEELHSWEPGKDDFNVSTTPLAHRASSENNRPRNLVCHDMKGGYLQDRFVQGYFDNDCYRFYHWSMVDTFVYFSHHFVTIPPPGWTNAGHKQGTRILGTFITEWDGGKACCDKFLQSEDEYQKVADKLVALAVYYKFDGWLLNIENKIEPELVGNLIKFVRYLTEQMHQHLSHSQVIWYDSVTKHGELIWQNELNMLNLPFFEASDGIFLNYTWKEENLANSEEKGLEFGRLHDVYVGVDVFGRGCFGGGGFNTVEAVEVVRQHALSVAIFAPAWVFEHHGGDEFTQNEDRFWSLLRSSCPPLPVQQLPLVTSFSQGTGHVLFSNGKLVMTRPWLFLAGQGTQPTPPGHKWEDQQNPRHHMNVCTKDAVEGGNCLRLSVSLQKVQSRKFRLFETNIPLPNELFVAYSSKNTGMDTVIELVLSGTCGNIYLCGQDVPTSNALVSAEDPCYPDREVREDDTTSQQYLRPLENKDKVYKQNFDTNCTWDTRSYRIQCSTVPADSSLKRVNIIMLKKSTSDEMSSCLLGLFQMVDHNALLELPLLSHLEVSIQHKDRPAVDINRVNTPTEAIQPGSGATKESTTIPSTVDVGEEKLIGSITFKGETHDEFEKDHQHIPEDEEPPTKKGCQLRCQSTCLIKLSWSFPPNAADYFKIYCAATPKDECKDIPQSSYSFLGHTNACAYVLDKDRLNDNNLSGSKYIFKVQPLLCTGFNIAWEKLPFVELLE